MREHTHVQREGPKSHTLLHLALPSSPAAQPDAVTGSPVIASEAWCCCCQHVMTLTQVLKVVSRNPCDRHCMYSSVLQTHLPGLQALRCNFMLSCSMSQQCWIMLTLETCKAYVAPQQRRCNPCATSLFENQGLYLHFDGCLYFDDLLWCRRNLSYIACNPNNNPSNLALDNDHHD